MTNKKVFQAAQDYLLGFEGVSEQMLNKHLEEYKGNKIKSFKDIFYRLCLHGKNRNMMASVISGMDILREPLFGFNHKKVLANYKDHDQLLKAFEKEYIKRNKALFRSTSRSLWPQYAKTVMSICYFLDNFKTFKEFEDLIHDYTNTDNTTVLYSLPMFISNEIHGFGFALACDFCKECISPKFVKPDIHLKDIFVGLGLVDPNVTDYQLFKIVVNYAESIGQEPYAVDKLFWLVGSGRFYLSTVGEVEFKINSNKFDFIDSVMKRAA